jgi:hypothetical protein
MQFYYGLTSLLSRLEIGGSCLEVIKVFVNRVGSGHCLLNNNSCFLLPVGVTVKSPLQLQSRDAHVHILQNIPPYLFSQAYLEYETRCSHFIVHCLSYAKQNVAYDLKTIY